MSFSTPQPMLQAKELQQQQVEREHEKEVHRGPSWSRAPLRARVVPARKANYQRPSVNA
jgi:hypothetical protein